MKLSSGAELKITLAPFTDARALYQAVLEEAVRVKCDPQQDLDTNFFKDVFCIGLSSKKIEAALWKCMEKVLYNGMKITDETFEPEAARGDYLEVCAAVAEENIRPFVKNLSAKFSPMLEKLKSALA
jgi:hypothetical protein